MRPAAVLVLVTTWLFTTVPATASRRRTPSRWRKANPPRRRRRRPRSSRRTLSLTRAAAAALPALHSLIVSRRGELLLEYYAPNQSRTRLAKTSSRRRRASSRCSSASPSSGSRSRASTSRSSEFPRVDEGPRAAQADHHHRAVVYDALGARNDQRRQLRGVDEEPQLGAPRADAATGQRAGTGHGSRTGTLHLLSAISPR